jgi:predicted dithiol-disulfide oxidoreductase (DUF899 family)
MFKPTNQALGCTWRGFAQPGMNCKNKNLEGGSMRNDGSSGMKNHPIVSHKEWLSARTAFLTKEKEFTRLRDKLSQQRRELPWERVNKEYVFQGSNGKQTLLELFDGRSQLIVYHFMFDPSWDAGCPHCSFWADNFNGIIVHLNHRDATMIAVSHAPYSKLAAYARRMGWSFKWVSSFETAFNFDYNASFTSEEMAKKEAFFNFTKQDPTLAEREGVSLFYKDPSGSVFHTYSAYARGIDMLNVAYHYLDLTPKGRDEADQGPNPQAWVRRHDEYKD